MLWFTALSNIMVHHIGTMQIYAGLPFPEVKNIVAFVPAKNTLNHLCYFRDFLVEDKSASE